MNPVAGGQRFRVGLTRLQRQNLLADLREHLGYGHVAKVAPQAPGLVVDRTLDGEHIERLSRIECFEDAPRIGLIGQHHVLEQHLFGESFFAGEGIDAGRIAPGVDRNRVEQGAPEELVLERFKGRGDSRRRA